MQISTEKGCAYQKYANISFKVFKDCGSSPGTGARILHLFEINLMSDKHRFLISRHIEFSATTYKRKCSVHSTTQSFWKFYTSLSILYFVNKFVDTSTNHSVDNSLLRQIIPPTTEFCEKSLPRQLSSSTTINSLISHFDAKYHFVDKVIKYSAVWHIFIQYSVTWNCTIQYIIVQNNTIVQLSAIQCTLQCSTAYNRQ